MAESSSEICLIYCGKEDRQRMYNITGRDYLVGIATPYGLDDSGIESLWGRDFPHPSKPVLGPTQPPVRWVPGLYRG